MVEKMTALLMALLIGVPFCCCVADAAPEAPAKEAHACCHKAGADASDAPENSAPCDCGGESKDPWALSADTKPAPPQWVLLSEVSWERLFESAVSSGRDSRRPIDSPEAARPPGGNLLHAHCRYRL